MKIAPFFLLRFCLLNFHLGLSIRLLVALVVGFAIRRVCERKRHVRNAVLGFLAVYAVFELYVDLSAMEGGPLSGNVELLALAFSLTPFLLAVFAGFLLTHLFLCLVKKEPLPR